MLNLGILLAVLRPPHASYRRGRGSPNWIAASISFSRANILSYSALRIFRIVQHVHSGIRDTPSRWAGVLARLDCGGCSLGHIILCGPRQFEFWPCYYTVKNSICLSAAIADSCLIGGLLYMKEDSLRCARSLHSPSWLCLWAASPPTQMNWGLTNEMSTGNFARLSDSQFQRWWRAPTRRKDSPKAQPHLFA